MRQKSGTAKTPSEQIIRDIRRATRKHYSAEDKIRIVLDGLRGEYSIAELCRREGIAESLYYSWSKEFLEAGKRRLAGDTARAATTEEVKELRREAQQLKEVVAEQALELRLLKKSTIAEGGDGEGDPPPLRSLRSSSWSSNPICRSSAHSRSSALPGRPFTTGTISTDPAVPTHWQITLHGQAGCGTASPMR